MAESTDIIEKYSSSWWWAELKREAKRGGEKWRKRAKKVVDRYRDERERGDNDAKFNILYSNIETLKPAVFGRLPVPVVKRRFADTDAATRMAGETIEKTLLHAIDEGEFEIDVEKARDDGLIAGRGVLWVEYEPEIVKRKPTRGPAPGAPPPLEAATALTPPMGAPGAMPLPSSPMAAPGGPMGMQPPLAPGAEAPPPWLLDGAPVRDTSLRYDDEDKDKQRPYVEDLADERVCALWVAWRDFRHTPIDDWKKVWWVARADYLTKEEAEEEFGGEKAGKLKYAPGETPEADEDAADVNDVKKPGRCRIWRIWCKRTKKVYVIADGYRDECLSETPLPFNVRGGFPCPEPYRPIGTTDRWEPIPEYCQYQDQAEEIDGYTQRIAKLTAAIVARGAAPPEIASALSDLSDKGDGQVIAVSNFLHIVEKGGFDKAIIWQPIQAMAVVLKTLVEQREIAKRNLAETIGISDIVRQVSNPNETLGAQQIKSNFGLMRMQPRQKPFERFIRATLRIMAEVIAEKFARRTLERITGHDLGSKALPGSPEAQIGDAVMALLRDDRLRSYRVDVETDSMLLPDEQADKANTVEYVTAVTQYLKAAGEIAAVQPEMAPLLLEMLRATSRRFKLGRELEETIEKTVKEIGAAAEQRKNQPPPPDPKAIEAQQRQAEAERKMQMEAAEAQAKAQRDAEQAGRDEQARQQEMAMSAMQAEQSAQLERFKAEMKAANERYIAEMKAEREREKLELQREIAAARLTLDHRKADDAAILAAGKQSAADAARSTL